MKKLLLIAAFGLLASPTLAQNVAHVEQADQSNSATVTQSGANLGVIGQGRLAAYSHTSTGNADNNEATLEQTGSGNEAYIGQAIGENLADPGTASGNSASVSQEGAGNFAGTAQGTYGATAVGNTLEITQDGSLNTAYVNQGVGSGALAEDNDADVSQAGTGNYADVSQVGTDGAADVSQSGASNETYIEQDGDGNSADVHQDGTGNVARVEQKITLANPANPQEAIIEQFGEDNYAYIEETGEGNWGRIRQDGARNQAYRESTDISGIRMTGRGNRADILQRGEENVARFNTSGSYNDFVITQEGPGGSDAFRNQAAITLHGSEGNAGQIVQSGDDNRAGMTLSQGADFNVDLSIHQAGDGNYAGAQLTHVPGGLTTGTVLDVVQSGNNNEIGAPGSGGGAGILVTGGTGNQIFVDQSGDANLIGVGGVHVQGDNNLVDITQSSDFNTATAQVIGQSNQAEIIQQ